MWRFGRFRAYFGTILFIDLWVSDVPFSISLFICDALLLYHITWLWLHFLVFGIMGFMLCSFFIDGLAPLSSLSICFPYLVLAGFSLKYDGVDFC